MSVFGHPAGFYVSGNRGKGRIRAGDTVFERDVFTNPGKSDKMEKQTEEKSSGRIRADSPKDTTAKQGE